MDVISRTLPRARRRSELVTRELA
ncbi:MAG: hypothetical protein QOH42_1829, partial [Blastocatellia bacterium]|nr:hypothetical protein [Blastocatellia bacterium]